MLATDTLSLVFISCFVVSGTFLILSSLLGFGHGHFHFGHIGHAGHVGHVGHAGPISHAASHASGVIHHALPQGHTAGHATHAAPHTGTSSGQSASTQAPGNPPIWATLLGYLNLYAIMAFLFWFGLIGYVLHNLTNFGSLSAFVGALLVGVVGAVLVNFAMSRLMGRGDDGVLSQESSEMIGTIGTVSLPIRAGGIGEVIYTKGTGGRKSIGARSVDGQAIPRDAEIVILGYEKGIAQVQTWDRFIAEHDDLDEEILRASQARDASAQATDVTASSGTEQS
jgi:membrane protein implicated in regulation of membrane protease activity